MALRNFRWIIAFVPQNCVIHAKYDGLLKLGFSPCIGDDKLTRLKNAWKCLEAERLEHVLFLTFKFNACRLTSAWQEHLEQVRIRAQVSIPVASSTA